MISMNTMILRHKTVRHKTIGGASGECSVIASVAKQSRSTGYELLFQHRGTEDTELHRASLRPLRFSPLRLCVKNSNAKTQRFYAKDAKKCQHEGTKAERHEVPSGLLRAIALAMTGNSLVSHISHLKISNL